MQWGARSLHVSTLFLLKRHEPMVVTQVGVAFSCLTNAAESELESLPELPKGGTLPQDHRVLSQAACGEPVWEQFYWR